MENTFESKNYRYNYYRMMMKKRTIMLLGLLLTVLTAVAGGTVKVACVGNSVTWGMTIPDREENCYPAQLQRMLGSGYKVRNFGHSGATLLRHGHRPYVEQKEYQEALDFKADLVVIHLGLNDTDPRNWPEHSEEFNADYIRLIDSFFRVNPKAKIWICLMTPIFDRHPRFESSTRDWYAAIQRHIRQIASTGKTSLIDLHTPLYGRPDLFSDAIHPNAEGAGIIARTVYGALTGKHGGLVLPPLYTDGMVFQRNEPVVFRGSADAGETVKVDFNGRVRSAVTDGAGKWSVTFPAETAGGPYPAVISNGRKTVTISEIYVGEVCSARDSPTWNSLSGLSRAENTTWRRLTGRNVCTCSICRPFLRRMPSRGLPQPAIPSTAISSSMSGRGAAAPVSHCLDSLPWLIISAGCWQTACRFL